MSNTTVMVIFIGMLLLGLFMGPRTPNRDM